MVAEHFGKVEPGNRRKYQRKHAQNKTAEIPTVRMANAATTRPPPERHRSCHEGEPEQKRGCCTRGAFAREAPDQLSKAGDVRDAAQRRERAGAIDQALPCVRLQL